MNLLSLLPSIFKPATELVDKMHTSDAEKMELKNALFVSQAELTAKVLDYEKAVLKAQSDIVIAEAKGESWLQRSWRPITMLTLASLVVAHWLGYTAPGLSEPEVLSLLGLVKIGLGGYVVGRSAEKIAPQVTDAIRAGRSQ